MILVRDGSRPLLGSREAGSSRHLLRVDLLQMLRLLGWKLDYIVGLFVHGLFQFFVVFNAGKTLGSAFLILRTVVVDMSYFLPMDASDPLASATTWIVS